jgi:hypothetical protein
VFINGSHQLQEHLLGIVEIEAHCLLRRLFVAFSQPIMDLPVAGQPRRLETWYIRRLKKRQAQLRNHVGEKLVE